MNFEPRSLALLLSALPAACRLTPSDTANAVPTPHRVTHTGGAGPRILAVVAHPDDEISFAGTLFKTATYLDGVCDVAVITNGEGGFKYATLSERIYGEELTEETVGRAHLPHIRKLELEAGCRLLGVRNLYFFEQKDHRYTTDLAEVLGPDARVWDVAEVLTGLRRLLQTYRYDFVFTLSPTNSTHAHHRAATLLALDAVGSLPENERPVVLCTRSPSDETIPARSPLPGLPGTKVLPEAFVFDRTQKFGHRQSLDYKIVINWAIAEHKSQGTMQRLMNRGDHETYLLFESNPPDAAVRTRQLFEQLAGDQFPSKTYSSSAGTNATNQ